MTDSKPTSGRKLAGAPALIALGALFFVLSLGLYAGAAKNDFIWDDPIVFQRQLPYFDSLSNVFFPPDSIPQFGIHYYRPVTVLSYMASEWGAKTFWPIEEREEGQRFTYHAAVVFWNALATLLVFLVGVGLARDAGRQGVGPPLVGSIAALLFATHPVHVEAVGWMAGCADVLCTVLVLASLLFYLRARRASDLVSAVLFGITALAAMMAKETGVSILFLVVLVELMLPRTRQADPAPMTRAERRRAARKKGPEKAPVLFSPTQLIAWALLGAGFLTYFSLRHSALQLFTTPAVRTPEPFMTAVFGSIGWYTKKLLWPPPHSAFVSGVPGPILTGLGLVIAVLAIALLAWQIAKRGPWVGELFAVGFYLATLAPALAIALLSISETRLAERYLYLPSVGGCLLAALLLERGARALKLGPVPRVAVPVVVALLVAVPAALASLERGAVWKNDLVFWEDAVAKSPDEGLPHLHLGIAYSQLTQGQDNAEARANLQRALEMYRLAFDKYDDREGRSKALNNRGSIHMQLGQYEQAVEAFRGALQEVPAYPTAYYNWALAEYNLAASSGDPAERQGRFNQSMLYLQEALRLNPRYVKAHLQFGKSLQMIGQDARARGHFEQVIALSPASREAAEARQRLGR